MRLAVVMSDDGQEIALERNAGISLPSAYYSGWPRLRDVMDLLMHRDKETLLEQLHAMLTAEDVTWHASSDFDFRAPVCRPPKNIMCLGWNYAEHARESMQAKDLKGELPQHPLVFTKAVTSVNGPFSGVPAHSGVTAQLDWEVELGVVIGSYAKGVSEAEALHHVFGYTIINDISARDLQARHKQFFLGKSLPGTCPMGPVLVTRDEISDPQNLDLRCWVNNELKQESNTRHQIFSVAHVVSLLSCLVGLEPGDVIATGTPSGVGFARNPPEFLNPGDVVKCEISGIGYLKNRII